MFMLIFNAILAWMTGGGVAAVAKPFLDAHKMNLDAAGSVDAKKVELVTREMALEEKERDVDAREVTALQAIPGGWFITAPMGIIGWTIALYIAKCVLIDKVARPFVMGGAGCASDAACPQLDRLMNTDPLGPDLAIVFSTVVAFYFGRAAIREVAGILKR